MDQRRSNIVADNICTFCESRLPPYKNTGGETAPIDCPCCGTFRITASAIDVIAHWALAPDSWAAIAYQIRRMSDRSTPPRLDTSVLKAIKETARLPHPDQILEDFLVWLGNKSVWGGWATNVTFDCHKSLLGAVDVAAFNYMIRNVQGHAWFEGDLSESLDGASAILDCRVSPFGWRVFRELNVARKNSRHGFVAMQYGDPELDSVSKDYFTPQVRLAGFELLRLDDNQPAGLIDDQLRVRIRTAKFLVCDLTHGNRGAYWEAGFAEGLGLPVIYACRKDVFDDRAHPAYPHFDTNHLVTVIWTSDDPGAGAKKLKDVIRATLPSEAVLEDALL